MRIFAIWPRHSLSLSILELLSECAPSDHPSGHPPGHRVEKSVFRPAFVSIEGPSQKVTEDKSGDQLLVHAAKTWLGDDRLGGSVARLEALEHSARQATAAKSRELPV
jgi:hypothetical protein